MSDPYDTPNHKNSSILGPTLKFKGDLIADEDLLIQGQVEGSIKHSSSLTIGEGGHVKADVSAEYIAVEGRVEGDLKGSKCVKVRVSAKIDGNIVSPSVSLIEGATFNGKIDMESDPTAATKPKPKHTESSSTVSKKAERSGKASKSKAEDSGKQDTEDKKPADAA
ncbi:MAG: polymer-forming cytoskeletal protein [Pseudomonadota bacterium]